MSYRFRRRAFMTALSGGVGLKIMLRNLESAAQGMRSPARLLVTHWPVGIVAGSSDALWKPTNGSVGGSPGLAPFADAGLGPDMTVIKGLSTAHLNYTGGGGHEQGTVSLMTGRAGGGSRANCCEGDDAYAAPGGSFDQMLLKNVPALQRPGLGYANSIADSRTDFGEISTQCLSYSTESRDVVGYNGATGGKESIPLMPVLSPLGQYVNLFSSFIPGTGGTGGGAGGTGGAGGSASHPVADATLKKLIGRRSVLDFAIEELNRARAIAPARARDKISVHTEAVTEAETAVVGNINRAYPGAGGGGAGGAGGTTGAGGQGGAAGSGSGSPTCGGGCTTKPTAPSALMGQADPPGGRGTGNFYGTGRDAAMQDDAPTHALVGAAHLSILKAAFICDLIRVGTYQWSPGINHVGFALFPNSTQPYRHHPVSHRIGTQNTVSSSTIAGLDTASGFLFNVQRWYFARQAETFAAWKTAVDGCGNNLLDFTCVPFLTEVRAVGHERSNMPAMLIGGKQLGFIHDRYAAGSITINELWGTIAQAFNHTPTDAAFGSPVAGFWTKPA